MKPPSAISSQLLQSLYSSKSRIRLLAHATSRPWYSTQSWPSGKRVIWLVSCSRVVPSMPGKQLSSSLRNASQSSSTSWRTRIWRSKAPRFSLAMTESVLDLHQDRRGHPVLGVSEIGSPAGDRRPRGPGVPSGRSDSPGPGEVIDVGVAVVVLHAEGEELD